MAEVTAAGDRPAAERRAASVPDGRAEEFAEGGLHALELAHGSRGQGRLEQRLVIDARIQLEQPPGAVGRHELNARDPGLPWIGRPGHVDPAAFAAPGSQIRDRAAGQHLAVVDDAHAVADPLDELEFVAREDHGDTCVRPFAEHVRHHVDGD